MTTVRRPTPLRHLAATMTLAGATLAAPAQQGTLDPGIPTASTIDASAAEALEAHAARWAAQLAAEDPAEGALARDRLIEPLRAAGVTVTFRLEYARVLIPRLREMMDAEAVGARLAAARVAGMLGTDDACRLLLGALASGEASVRLFAATQLGEALSLSASGAGVLTPETGLEIVGALGTLVAGAESPLEAGAAARALAQGVRIEQRGFDRARNQAGSQLGASTGKRVRALGAARAEELELIVALDACAAGRNAVTAPSSRPDADATREIVGMGGDVLAWALARFIDERMPPVGERTLETQVVAAAENVIYFARRHHASLLGQNPAGNPTRIAQALREGDDRTFRTAALALLGRDGELVSDFGFARERFLSRGP